MHLWDYDSGHYPWLLSKLPGGDKMIGNYDPIRKNYLVSDYAHSISGSAVKQCVHIQVFGYPEDSVLETQWLQKQADAHGYPHAIVGLADFTADNIDEVLTRHCSYQNVRGIRNVLSHHSDPDLCMITDPNIMQDERWLQGFSLMKKHNLSFDVQIFDHQLDDLVTLAHAHQDTNIIINHIAWPTDLSSSGFANWKDRVKTAANCSNVSIKISGFGCVFKHIELDEIMPYVVHCVDVFGVDRCIWGSNFPVASLFTTYANLLQTGASALSDLSAADQDKIFYANAAKFYSI